MPRSCRRKTRRRRQSRRQRGGKKIGKGDFGVVFRPPLLCAPPQPAQYTTDNYIGKQQIDDHHAQELDKIALVQAVDPLGIYTVTNVHSCSLAPAQTNTNYLGPELGREQIIYPYAGIDLEHALQIEALWDPARFATVNVPQIMRVLRALKAFLPHLREFNQHYIHGDLHLSNLIYDGEVVKMIDFATIQTRADMLRYIEKVENKYTPAQVEEEVSIIDVRRIYESLRGDVRPDISEAFFNSPFMQQEPYKKQFRYWLMASPKVMKSAESYYTAFSNMPVE